MEMNKIFFAKWAGYKTKVLAGTQEAQLWSMTISLLPTLLSGINTALIMTIGGFFYHGWIDDCWYVYSISITNE